MAAGKTAIAGLRTEYEQEGEEPEHVGERLAVLDDDRRSSATVEVTAVDVHRRPDVPSTAR